VWEKVKKLKEERKQSKDSTPQEMEDYFEREDLIDLQKIEEKPKDEQMDTPKVQEQPKRLSYTNRNGGSLRINRF
jgi:hypothetical protein